MHPDGFGNRKKVEEKIAFRGESNGFDFTRHIRRCMNLR
jgi:hypothetical protein